jgi:Protein of unknown function (DUF3618)
MTKHNQGSRTPEEEALAGEIEQTRQQLGETVEALAAKTDVKARAQHRAAEVTSSLRGKARVAKDKVTERAAELRDAAPAPVGRPVGDAVVIVRGHRGKAAAAALAGGVLILTWLTVRHRRR